LPYWSSLKINNFPPYIIKLIDSYLTDRFYRVHVGDGVSKAREVKWGVAQVHNIPRTESLQLSMDAEDAALFVQSWRLEIITNRLNRVTLSLNKYFNRWIIKMNPTKSRSEDLTGSPDWTSAHGRAISNTLD
jgi:hypothetical protein